MQSIKCPNCQTVVGKVVLKDNDIPLIGGTENKEIIWLKDPLYRPFCCKHCQTIDLGAWADGSYSIPTSLKPEDYNVPDSEGPE